jgi:hypothetical protein
MKLDIQGQQVEVDDSFAGLSPEEQNATVEDIARQMNIHAQVKQEQVATANQPKGNVDQFREQNPWLEPVLGAVGTATDPENLKAFAPYAAGAAGLYKANKIANTWMAGAEAAAEARKAQAAAEAAAEAGRAARFAAKNPMAPTTPTYNVPTAQTPNMATRPLGTPGPVVPEPMPAQAANAVRGAQAAEGAAAGGSNWMAQALNMARQYAPALAKVGVGTALMAPTSTGPAVPSVGRMRGSEINPLTGRPWTPDQIAQYEKNYPMFDQQLAASQMRR